MNELLPENFAPTNSAVEVAVSPTQVVPTDDETTAAMRRMGGVEIGQYELRDLAMIGAHVRRAGVLRSSRGRAMVNQQMLKNVMEKLAAEISKLEQKPKKTRSDLNSMERLSHAVSRLSDQLTNSQRLLI